MKYAYEDLSDAQFENLVVLLCQELFGLSVQGFAPGKDGGRDGKFEGTADHFPSKAKPWAGITIIQAKHSNGLNRSFSENDFFSETSRSTVIGKEIPRINSLVEDGKLDNYILFSNRRMTAGAESKIKAAICSQCGLLPKSVYLCDVNKIELWLKKFGEVASQADLDPVDSPLIVSPDDLAEVVEAFAEHRGAISDVLDDPPTSRTTYEGKNELNGLSADYAANFLKKYLKETAVIREFLASPENLHLLLAYESAVDEFQAKIISKRKDYQSFDEVLEYLLDLLFARDVTLRQRNKKRLTRALLFYMYWNCDIGKDKHDPAD